MRLEGEDVRLERRGSNGSVVWDGSLVRQKNLADVL
jgi:hypothetical protein